MFLIQTVGLLQMYVPGQLTDVTSVMVELGTGYYAEMVIVSNPTCMRIKCWTISAREWRKGVI